LANVMLIKKHDKSRIVELEDGSLWRIWPGDIALTLSWLPTTDLRVSEIGDEFCSHALIDQGDGSRVRVIEASKTKGRKISVREGLCGGAGRFTTIVIYQ